MDDRGNQRRSWWDGGRVVLAFCVAPLGYPATMAVLSLLNGWPPSALPSIAWSFLPISYVATTLIGVPLYRLLCVRNLTAFWIAPVAGFVVGASLSTFVYSLATFGFGLNLPLREGGVVSIKALAGLLQNGGLSGATVGVFLWLIARPDRDVACCSTPSS
jgi:hypothetical protein